MSRPPTHKRMCNPCGIPDAKFFAERKRRRKKPQRSEPLPGTKQTLSSKDDGVLEQMFTAHDSTTIPKPAGGRRLVAGKDDGSLGELLKQRKHGSESALMMKILEYASIALALSVLILQFSIFRGSGADGWQSFYAGWCTFLVHVCVFFGQCFSGGRNKRLWISLGLTYLGWIYWSVVTLVA